MSCFQGGGEETDLGSGCPLTIGVSCWGQFGFGVPWVSESIIDMLGVEVSSAIGSDYAVCPR